MMMKTAWIIGQNDIRLFLRDKAGYIWLFVVPIAFIFFTGFANRPPGEPSNPQPRVLIENQDTGPFGELFLRELENHGLQRAEDDDPGNAPRGIRIPTDFSENISHRKAANLEFFQRPGSGDTSAALIEMRLVHTLIRLNAGAFEVVVDAEQSGKELTAEALAEVLAEEDPVPLQVRFAGRNPIPAGFNQSLPGNLVMFLMMNLLIFGGVSLTEERQKGLMRRFAACPIQKSQLVLGKIIGRFLLGLVQIVFFLLVGQFLFHVNVGRVIVAVLTTLAVYGWVAASLGVLIGSLTRESDKTVGLCILVSLVMAAIGGCWWPMEIVPDSINLLGHLFPTAWTMDALHQLISYGGSWQDVLPELATLAGYAAAATIAAAKFLRY